MLEVEHRRGFSDFLKILRRPTYLLTEEPTKEEIFSVERLEQYAEHLASELIIKSGRSRGRPLLPTLKSNGKKLLQAYNSLAEAIRGKQNISPAAEWLVDNFHIVEDQLREIKQDLPTNFYHELPKLASGELAGYPRVYAIAMAIIAHTDSRLDAETLKRFILAFQKDSQLSIGELWAIPITLRISLVERLRPLAELIVTARNKREEADQVADRLLALADRLDTTSEDLVKTLSQELNSVKKFDRAFVVQLIQRLRDQDPDVWPAFDWLELQLEALGTDAPKVTELEHFHQASAQVTVGNIISSMRLLSALEWRSFFEAVSLVDPILALDPATAYSGMDFATRDRYRHEIERIAKRSSCTEMEIANTVLSLAKKSQEQKPSELKQAHVGYYLIGPGLNVLEKNCLYRPTLRETTVRFYLRHPTIFYLGFYSFLVTLLLFPLVKYFRDSGGSATSGIFFAILALSAASEFALTILNHYVTLLLKPRTLPKMNTEGGIPEDAKTMVVIPTLFSSEKEIQKLLEALQVHYLANQDSNIYFALLSDFKDAPNEHLPEDKILLSIADNGIKNLNNRYSEDGELRFHLFHRQRQWNTSEESWIGWERKRGKLEEFNRLLRGESNTSFLHSTADQSLLRQIKYVITLDSDTDLPRDAALQLIGTILHPLNQPRIDPVSNQVVEGYGILQPRVSVSLVSASRSRFAKIFSGNTGLDPYTTAVSDVYQDLFKEGSFVGKGLYVVDALRTCLANRVPENTILSHDLFEGSYARSALVSDVELFDDYPIDFETYLKRQHRWTRGDWQISQWLLPRVPSANQKALARNTLSTISKWKIYDNLRRSLVPPTILLWLILSWTVLPGSSLTWTILVFIMIAFPVYAPVANNLLLRRRGMPIRSRIMSDFGYTKDKLIQIFFTLSFIVDLAYTQTDAIARTFYRKFISRKKLLEWVTFSQLQSLSGERNSGILNNLGPAPLVAVVTAVLIVMLKPESFLVSAPFLISWLSTPLLKQWVKNKTVSRRIPLGDKEKETFRLYARKTWHFFETFGKAEDNWLAPDNFQEDPVPVIARRTSPTNIGLQLLSIVSAYDFGYLGLHAHIDYIEKVFNTISKLQKHNGHLFNWYDTQSLEPLRPQYISTVDSGNLAGHLLTLKQALIELRRRPLINSNARNGIIDTLQTLISAIDQVENKSRGIGDLTLKHLRVEINSSLLFTQTTNIHSFLEWKLFLTNLQRKLNAAEDTLNAIAMNDSHEKFIETRIWIEAALCQVKELLYDLKTGESSVLEADVGVGLLIPFSDDNSLHTRIKSLINQCDKLVIEMNFKFLFDEQRKIFVIGFNVTEAKRDNSYYDLLASESRLASFVAIAKGEVPKEHWFRLGRQITAVSDSRVLISWSATMFEYLMPLLVMQRYSGTLLDQTYETVVKRQIEYGKQQSVPWGISEAGYNARDLQLNYQYGPFGIPGIGLKRGLSDDLVVSPYSTMLASVIDPWAALRNLEALEKLGAFARYGFYESIDYTPYRLPKKQKHFILRSFMAHHQGMSLVSLNNLLNNQTMQKRFHAEPLVQATQLILQERIPLGVTIRHPRNEELNTVNFLNYSAASNVRVYNNAHLPTPRTQILSNGTHSVMLTTSGSGYSRYGKKAVTRWREDVTRDHWGQFFYIRNRSTGEVWSPGYQPTMTEPKSYQVSVAEDKIEFWREDGQISTHMEIIVSPEDNVELRRISLTNSSTKACEIEVTSFSEIVLAPQADDVAHPAFSNLFVQTEYITDENALLATRRRRSQTEAQIWGFHVLVTETEISGSGVKIGHVQYETDRSRFLGRGRDLSRPFVIAEDLPLSETIGAVLDPIFSLRQSLLIPPGETMWITFATGVAETRDEALRLADKYHDIHIFNREAELAWTKAQVQLRHLNLTSDKAHVYQRLAGRVIFSDPSLRPKSHNLAKNTQAQSSLWAHGISGDLPIVLTRINDEKDMEMVRELLHAHEYLRLKGLIIDLVILNERAPSYIQSLQEELQRQIRMSGSQALMDKPGGVFIRRTDIMSQEDVILLKTVARVTLIAEKGTLDEQLKRRPSDSELPETLTPLKISQPYLPKPVPTPELSFFNGLGGFSDHGRNYVTVLRADQWTPAPWINVIANSHEFGFIVSESGSSYTWSENSRENRLTPWSNDAVSDPSGEIIYLRDEETGEVWTPTPLPIRDAEPYTINHGQGYTEFSHTSHNISQELKVFVPLDMPVKINRLSLTNLGKKRRKISVTNYVEWVLGFDRGASSPHVITEKDSASSTIFAHNPYNNEFSKRIAFVGCSEQPSSYTCDRKEFIGRNGSLRFPDALSRVALAGTTGAGYDPCAALQITLNLEPGEEKSLVFLLGETTGRDDARLIIEKYRRLETVDLAFKNVNNFWNETLGTLEIKTPDVSMNTIFNRWLLYQTLCCRIWARTAFYQSGGAYGFRDQLQDVMALVYSKPQVTRTHILRAAARQFEQGDVQHWWHPPTGRGVRTHCSDDLLWLPYVTSFYVEVTGDHSILEETVPFIDAMELAEGQDDSYTQPQTSKQTATLLEHCCRSLDKSLKVGRNGLPLMGAGDWNDGMNRVGHEGKGESVWVGWFLYSTIKNFLPLCQGKDLTIRRQQYENHSTSLKASIEKNAWDGDWYRRAFFDDGTALGSAANQECRIDSIAQSWSVLSDAGQPERATRAMAAVDQHLVHRGDGLVKLFTPPFDQSHNDPGYIKGYLPGVRENGGQYTHAAIWALMAFAKLGDGNRAGELYAILNPINHSSTRANLHKYKVEPYVAAADIYGLPPHIGRGGWTWYTGSSSWMYRSALESILGFKLRGDVLEICPCIPDHWEGFEIKYKFKSTDYKITAYNSKKQPTVEPKIDLDGLVLKSKEVKLVDDGLLHLIKIHL